MDENKFNNIKKSYITEMNGEWDKQDNKFCLSLERRMVQGQTICVLTWQLLMKRVSSIHHLNVLTEPFKIMGCGRGFQSDIAPKESEIISIKYFSKNESAMMLWLANILFISWNTPALKKNFRFLWSQEGKTILVFVKSCVTGTPPT